MIWEFDDNVVVTDGIFSCPTGILDVPVTLIPFERPALTAVEELEKHKEDAIKILDNLYSSKLAEGVICHIPGVNFTMDAYFEDALALKHGIELAQANGVTEITVTDIHNIDHEHISIDDAFDINKQQANNFAYLRQRRNERRTNIKKALTKEIVDQNTTME